MEAYVGTRPAFTEVEPIRRAIYLAEETGCPLHICHIACKEGIEEVKAAQARGVNVTGETCTHYLYFDLSELNELGPVAKCSPPIREKEQQEAIWDHLFAGDVSFVTSDHSPCTPDLKDKDNAFEAWGGISGLQSNVDMFFDEAIQKRGMSLAQFAELIATNPAKRFGLNSKGSISIGKDADFVLIKPNSPHTLRAEDLEYRNKISPYLDREYGAQIATTIVRGNVVYDLEDGVAEEFVGEFIHV